MNSVITTSATAQEVAAYLVRQESYDPTTQHIIRYSKPHDTSNGIEVHLGNQAGGFPFTALGHEWRSAEHLYLCGEWSEEGAENIEIQKDVISATNGYAAKRYKKSKHKQKIRPDFTTFRHQWMLWRVWKKCLGSEKFRKHLLSIPDDAIIVEVVKKDPVWAADEDANTGRLNGANGLGKILTYCRQCLKDGKQPAIDTDALNNAGIYILGERVKF